MGNVEISSHTKCKRGRQSDGLSTSEGGRTTRDGIPEKHLGKQHGKRKQPRTEGEIRDDHQQGGTDQNDTLHRTGPQMW